MFHTSFMKNPMVWKVYWFLPITTLPLGVNGERALTFSVLSTDLFTVGSDGNKTFNQYLATLGSLDGRVSDYWNYHYSGISQCNVTLQYVTKTDIADSRKAVIEAEARFLRGVYFFDLVQHYGKNSFSAYCHR